jgi:hypothetical protein
VVEGDFHLPTTLLRHQAAVVSTWSRQRRLNKGDRPSPRVRSVRTNADDAPGFSLQRAGYYQQVATNLTLDRQLAPPLRAGKRKYDTVRRWDIAQAGLDGSLPSFEASALANTIGVAVGITAKTRSGTEVIIISRRRRDRVAVYAGMWHLPLTFALERDLANEAREGDIRTLIRFDYGAELQEELRLQMSDLHELRPLAFCRDLIRGGKPQFFLEARSRWSVDELRRRAQLSREEYRGHLRPMAMPETLDGLIGRCSPELIAFVALKIASLVQ